MFIEPRFIHGEYVQLKTDDENKKRIVTALLLKEKNYVEYQIVCGLEQSWHTESEIEKYNPKENNTAGFKKKSGDS